MLHIDNNEVRKLLLKGNFGLEKESLRVTPLGFFAQTKHPFPGNHNIVYDYCENQTEINTPVFQSAEEAVESLYGFTQEIQKKLAEMPEPELLWPFSNPSYIRNAKDIPDGAFDPNKAYERDYRQHIQDRYGKYKMCLCGIHVNFSFADELLQADFACSDFTDFQAYKDDLYVALAENCTAYAWIMTAVTAASPVMDSSYYEVYNLGQTLCTGLASTRCSELGYWNFFAPLLNYKDIKSYADSIKHYVDMGLIKAPSELYFPIRLKPPGKNLLQKLHDEGVCHIELRMVDLNPLELAGINVLDLKFAHYMLVYLASLPRINLSEKEQVECIQNFKNAAHFDLNAVKLDLPGDGVMSIAEAGARLIDKMKDFYKDFPSEVMEVLDFEQSKLYSQEKRYAWKIRREYGSDFVKKGLEHAKKQQEAMI